MTMNRISVIRKAIKLRHPIQKDFCNCHGVGVLTVEGQPYIVMADGISKEKMKSYLDTVQQSAGIYFSEDIEECKEKVYMCIDNKLPVTIRTSTALNIGILEKLREVPHSGVHVSIDFLQRPIGISLENLFSEVRTLREMMFVAKSWGIFVGVVIDYFPHIISKLDLFEVCEMLKGLGSHVMITFPDVTDELYHVMRDDWYNFKEFYHPDVPSRTWRINESYKKEFLVHLKAFLKSRKMSLENINISMQPRIRHIPTGLSELALGISPFYFQKGQGGVFEPIKELVESPCSKCGKTLLT
jgi:hypothetical protein